MKKFLLFGIFLLFGFGLFSLNTHPAYSDELDDLNKQINELKASLEASKKATTTL